MSESLPSCGSCIEHFCERSDSGADIALVESGIAEDEAGTLRWVQVIGGDRIDAHSAGSRARDEGWHSAGEQAAEIDHDVEPSIHPCHFQAIAKSLAQGIDQDAAPLCVEHTH